MNPVHHNPLTAVFGIKGSDVSLELTSFQHIDIIKLEANKQAPTHSAIMSHIHS